MSKVTFIHTADLHLESHRHERLDVLKWLLAKAKEWEAGIIVSGDLFNSGHDANLLCDTVRDIFSSFPEVAIFIIPGHIDNDAFASGFNYGDNVLILKDCPYSEVEYRGVKIVGVPHQCNSSLKQAISGLKKSDISILVVHGTFFDDSAKLIREEVKNKGEDYFPVYLEDIESESFIYIAMGHFHSNVVIHNNPNNKACYPGAPVSLEESDVGFRKIAKVVIDTVTRDIEVSEHQVEIGIYRLRKELWIYPGRERAVMMTAIRYLTESVDIRADVKLELNGYIKSSEGQMNKLVESMKDKFAGKFHNLEIVNNTACCRQLLDNHPLAKEFMSRLEKYEISDTVKKRAVELGLKAFESELTF